MTKNSPVKQQSMMTPSFASPKTMPRGPSNPEYQASLFRQFTFISRAAMVDRVESKNTRNLNYQEGKKEEINESAEYGRRGENFDLLDLDLAEKELS